MIKLPEGIVVETLPCEIRYASVVRGLTSRIKRIYDDIYKHFGENGLAMIEKTSHAYGTEIAGWVRKDSDPWTIREVGLYLVKVFNNMRSEGEVTEFNDKRVAIQVPCCPYPFEKVEICRAHTTMERALVQGLNPELDYEIEKNIPAGDAVCLHVLKVRE
ncbi:hypothetical protein K9N50_04900 [bacterium]|nr:hypothetical protein [bacterium]